MTDKTVDTLPDAAATAAPEIVSKADDGALLAVLKSIATTLAKQSERLATLEKRQVEPLEAQKLGTVDHDPQDDQVITEVAPASAVKAYAEDISAAGGFHKASVPVAPAAPAAGRLISKWDVARAAILHERNVVMGGALDRSVTEDDAQATISFIGKMFRGETPVEG